MKDLDFKIEDNIFNARVSAIIYNKDKTKILLFKIIDREYYLLPGGRIKLNEDSSTAITREIIEELGYNLEYKLYSIDENFLIRNNTNIMQYNFIYKALYTEDIKDIEFKCLDNNYSIFKWIDINKIDNEIIYPKIIKEYIKDNQEHIVHNIDRSINND